MPARWVVGLAAQVRRVLPRRELGEVGVGQDLHVDAMLVHHRQPVVDGRFELGLRDLAAL